MQLIESILAEAASIAALRRDIHQHPELCFEELRTADLIAKALTDWGIPVHRGLGKTGVVGIIRNGSSKRSVGLRADIDALPITERNASSFTSWMLTLPIVTDPAFGSNRREITLRMVLFPEPESPTSAVILPDGKRKLTSFKTVRSGTG